MIQNFTHITNRHFADSSYMKYSLIINLNQSLVKPFRAKHLESARMDTPPHLPNSLNSMGGKYLVAPDDDKEEDLLGEVLDAFQEVDKKTTSKTINIDG